MSRHRDAAPDSGRQAHHSYSNHPTAASLSSPAAATPNGAAPARGFESVGLASAGVASAGGGLGSGDGAFGAGSGAGYGQSHVGGEELFGSGGPTVHNAGAGPGPGSATSFGGGSNGGAPSRASFGSGSIRDAYACGPPGVLHGFVGEGRKMSQGECSSTQGGEGSGIGSGGVLTNDQGLPSLQHVSSVECGVEQGGGPLGLHFVGVSELAEGEGRSSSIPLFPQGAPSSSHHSLLHSQPSCSSIGGDS
eukprot:scaffold265818_cov18-Tisochrysis_lutea.AAC.1